MAETDADRGQPRETGAASDERPIELTIVMPCLNEAETLGRCLQKASAFLQTNGVSGEIVVGDNGSTDGSIEIARRLGARVVEVPVRGYGAALHYATLAARGRFVIMGDSDDSYDFSNLMPFLAKLREGYDLVMGNRFAGGIAPGAMPWKNRYIGNPILSGIGRVLFHSPASDFHCGIRGYSIGAFRRMDLQTTGMEYASEMVIKATLFRMRIADVPTTLAPDGRSRPPHLRPWRDGWRHLRFMLLYSPDWLFLYPGIALMIAGTLVGAWLLPSPREVGGVVLDVHSLLYAAVAVAVGFQALTFSRFTRVFCHRQRLFPGDPTPAPLALSLEASLVIGCVLIVAGVAGSLWAVAGWGGRHFGPLDVRQTLRIVIPSALAIILGAEIGLASFFLSVLGLRTRQAPAPLEAEDLEERLP